MLHRLRHELEGDTSLAALYARTCTFTSRYLEHIAEEEELIDAAIGAAYRDEELTFIGRESMARTSPDDARIMLRLMLPSLTLSRSAPSICGRSISIWCHSSTRAPALPIPPHSRQIGHSHSIISEPLNRLFCLVFCASHRTDTVRHTVEKDRWSSIDPDRSRKTPKHALSYSLLPHPNAFRLRPFLPSNAKAFYRRRYHRS
jgi:hypothetical protein